MVRLLELLVTDVAEESAPVRTEWIHRHHIESVEAFGGDHGQPLWLELTLTSGRLRYVPVGATEADPADAARSAVRALLEDGQLPVVAAR